MENVKKPRKLLLWMYRRLNFNYNFVPLIIAIGILQTS